MRIAFVIKTLSLPGGGAERVLAVVSAELARRGYEVEIVTFDGGEPFYRFDVPIHSLGVGSGSGVYDFIRRTVAVGGWANRNKPDAIIAFMHSAYVPCALAFVGPPLIASEHIVYSHYPGRPIENLLAKIARGLSNAVTVISEPMRKGFPGGKRMHVIPNPITPADGRADPVGNGSRTILSIGRMEEQKNQELLLCAFAAVADEFPDWNLRIVGSGPLRPRLMRLVHELGLIGRAYLPNAHSNIAEEYRSAQIFAMPSTYESFGMVTAEALQYGLPVVGLESCPGTNELVVEGRNGLLAKSDTDFVVKLREMMADDRLRVRLSSGLSDPERFSIGRVTDLWEKLIHSII